MSGSKIARFTISVLVLVIGGVFLMIDAGTAEAGCVPWCPEDFPLPGDPDDIWDTTINVTDIYVYNHTSETLYVAVHWYEDYYVPEPATCTYTGSDGLIHTYSCTQEGEWHTDYWYAVSPGQKRRVLDNYDMANVYVYAENYNGDTWWGDYDYVDDSFRFQELSIGDYVSNYTWNLWP